MRGKRPGTPGKRRHGRNIPAYAGKTPRPFTGVCTVSEHPRVCGENKTRLLPPRLVGGTSPRMRGKLLIGTLRRVLGRNIPAYAGKTGPEVQGGHHVSGTSPRMRGKRIAVPAMVPLTPEHPRVCGENLQSRPTRTHQIGTSPRMRGKLPRHRRRRQPLRNIPAYAGKTSPSGVFGRRAPEHPRVCGEN